MALNWAMIDATGLRPVPLPEEKIWLAVEGCQMSLEFKDPKAKWEAKGTAYVTNQRVIFLRVPPLPSAADQSAPSEHLRSLNIPLTHLVDSRYMIPILAGPYYEAGVIPVPGGNLPEGQPGGPTVKGLLKIWFLEGQGTAFRDAVEEVRNLSKGEQHGEPLPAYQPPAPGTPGGASVASGVAPSIAATANSSLGGRTIGGREGRSSEQSSIVGSSYVGGRPESRASQMAPEDLEAARVAMQQEEAEREALRQQAERNEPTPEFSEHTGAQRGDEPPAYVTDSPITTFVRAPNAGGQGRESNTQVRAQRFRIASTKILQDDEGRDRALQLFHGLFLLIHHTFGSVRRPRSFGLYPVPHILFFLFPRSFRRETLRRLLFAGEAVEDARRMLLLLHWCVAAGRGTTTAASASEGDEVQGTPREADDNSSPEAKATSSEESRGGASRLKAWQEHLGEAAEVLATCGEVCEVAAFLGGSSIAWRIARGGYAMPGQKALRFRQRRGLERLGIWFEVSALAIQLYIIFVCRHHLRKRLGRIHRRVLLLTDELADAQGLQTPPEKKGNRRHARLPPLHSLLVPSPTTSTAIPLPAISEDIQTGGSQADGVEKVARDLSVGEARFRQMKHQLRQLSLEAVTTISEGVFALYELVAPRTEKEGWEAWSAIFAGGSGLLKVVRD